jgi:hypothetical protein
MRKNLLTTLFFVGIIIAGNFIAFKMVHLPNQMQFVVLLGLLMFYPVFRYPLVGVYFMFILLPFVPLIRRLYYLAYSRPAVDPLIVIGEIILAIMIFGLFFVLREHIQKGTFRQGITFLVMVYFLYMLLRVFLFSDLHLQQGLLKFRFYGPQVLLYFVGMLYAFEDKHIRRLWVLTLIVGVAAVLYGLNQFFFGYNEAEKLWFSSIDFASLFIKGIARPFSFFLSPASFADYAQIAVISLIAITGFGRISGRFTLLLIPLFIIGVLITSVRSNWVGMAFSFFVWLFIVRVKGNRQRIIVLTVISVACVLFDVGQNLIHTGMSFGSFIATSSGNSSTSQNIALLVTERTNAISNPFQEYSMVSRIELWKYIIQSSIDPQLAVFGRGLGVINADSLYMTYLANFGYPGLLLLVAIIVVFIKNGFQLLDTGKNKFVLAVAKAVVTMDIVFAIINITGSHIHSFPGDTYFWFWNGILMGMWTGREEREEEEDEAPVDA